MSNEMSMYGPKVDFKMALQMLKFNARLNLGAKIKFATCLWGMPGIGKTSFIKALENEPVTYKGKRYPGYKIVDIPPAQLEEMGDILGIPMECQLVSKGGVTKWAPTETINTAVADGWVVDQTVAPTMQYAPPAWVPTRDEPTILLFDDWNRASGRLIKGVMQLIQNGGTISWKLPESVQIVLTGNPDTEGMLVAQVDDAIMTRIKSMYIEPDAEGWINWALANDVSPVGVAFFKHYPELVIGKKASGRDNLRTFTEFCRALDLCAKDGLPLNGREAAYFGRQSVSDELVLQFQNWYDKQYALSLTPDMILGDSPKALAELKRNKDDKRMDIISLSCDRLAYHIIKMEAAPQPSQVENFHKFLLSPDMPPDCMFALLNSLKQATIGSTPMRERVTHWLAGNEELGRRVAKLMGMKV